MAHINQGQFGDAQVLSPEGRADIETPLVNRRHGMAMAGAVVQPLYEAGAIGRRRRSLYEAPIMLEHGGSIANFAAEALSCRTRGMAWSC